ncbi:MAG: HAMP domain-containing histidine kinase [Metallibacterium scheffleri]|jgi:signal transduction histidine kinase|uniref:sensor histidine kinase n=1 Tax=Metallibacterium scheffleri TaxID=993689 RepID=UPI0026EFEFC6|nr:HAMP domain-containing sensor histidine kinase [Metallibacterium scheffleri]MCK9367335.1 HAMP domain-containing histidine kinase [Metallibacterium scheffleri]
MRRIDGIRRKIWAMFVLQLAAITFATILGVYGAAAVLEDVLIKRALVEEAAHYWQRIEHNPVDKPPNTANLRGFLQPSGQGVAALPDYLRSFTLGYHRLNRPNGHDLVYVSDWPNGRLFLVFKQEQVDKLAFFFGFVPLTVVLLIIYITLYFTYRASRRALSPVIALASVVRELDPLHPDLGLLAPDHLPSDADGDVLVLAGALHRFASRNEQFIERERNFTRDASHELRSPLTVIKVAADVLEEEASLTAFGQRSVQRIRRAVRDMESLIQAFLILAREGDVGLPDEDFVVNDVLREEIDKAQDLVAGKPVKLELVEQARLGLYAPARAFAVLMANLIRNACLYTEHGSIRVVIAENGVRVMDTGIGMSAEELAQLTTPFFRAQRGHSDGHGIGLNIVRRLAERFDWEIGFASKLNAGTTVSVRFPNARSIKD